MTSAEIDGNVMREFLLVAAFSIGLSSTAQGQTFDKNKTIGSLLMDTAERKRNFLIGLGEGLGSKYPNVRFSYLTKCLEEAADFPGNWPKEVGPFVRDCIEKAPTR